jgi:hypothetical protein
MSILEGVFTFFHLPHTTPANPRRRHLSMHPSRIHKAVEVLFGRGTWSSPWMCSPTKERTGEEPCGRPAVGSVLVCSPTKGWRIEAVVLWSSGASTEEDCRLPGGCKMEDDGRTVGGSMEE